MSGPRWCEMNRCLVPAAIVVALALGACGSDADMSSTDTTTGTSTTETGTTDTNSTTAPAVEFGKDGPADGVRRLWIKPDLVDCVGAAPQKCMQVAEAEDGQYNYFYDQIDGFTFEEGTTYVVDVRVDEIDNPPADAGMLRFTLIEIVER
jgi:hypothetical protein